MEVIHVPRPSKKARVIRPENSGSPKVPTPPATARANSQGRKVISRHSTW